jgi:quaternary ammonium compound-resistance protein SugE
LTNPWITLIAAGLFEIGWPAGLKLAQKPETLTIGIVLAVVCMGISGYLLWLAQRDIPIGTAYAVWTGIGAAGTFALGVAVFGDAVSLLKLAGVALIILGVATLKLAEGQA